MIKYIGFESKYFFKLFKYNIENQLNIFDETEFYIIRIDNDLIRFKYIVEEKKCIFDCIVEVKNE